MRAQDDFYDTSSKPWIKKSHWAHKLGTDKFFQFETKRVGPKGLVLCGSKFSAFESECIRLVLPRVGSIVTPMMFSKKKWSVRYNPELQQMPNYYAIRRLEDEIWGIKKERSFNHPAIEQNMWILPPPLEERADWYRMPYGSLTYTLDRVDLVCRLKSADFPDPILDTYVPVFAIAKYFSVVKEIAQTKAA